MRTYTGCTNCDDRATDGNSRGQIMVNLLENCRDPDEIARLNENYVQNGLPPKYDISKANMNIYYESCKTEEEAFQYVFGESMERYNAGQKRNDRKTSMAKELAKLEKGKVQQELIHCMVVQYGNHENHPPVDECVDMLNEYYVEFKERYPNMIIISAAIHLDELGDGSPHLQIYFVPVKTKERHEEMRTSKKWHGMDIQPSLTGALEQMGYSNDATVMVPKKDENGEPVLDANGEPVMVEKHDYKHGAMAQWQKDFNGLLDEIALNHGIVIDHYMRGKKVTHQDTRDYYSGKIGQETMRAKHDLDKANVDLTRTLLDVENAQGETEKLVKENRTLKEKNAALKGKYEALEGKAKEAEERIAVADANLTRALLSVENAQEKAEKLQEKNKTLQEQNKALWCKYEVLEQKADAAESRLANAKGAFARLMDSVSAWVDAHNGLQRVLRIAKRLSNANKAKVQMRMDKALQRGNKALSKSMETPEDIMRAADEMERGKRVFDAGRQAVEGNLDIDELLEDDDFEL